MSKFIERWFHCDPRRALLVEREIKVWLAYFGMLCFGGLLFGAPLYVWFDRYTTDMRSQYQGEVQRLQDTNGQLIVIIQDRLPAITATVETAAKTAQAAASTAKGAATGAGRAAKAASGAAVEAKSAASTVQNAATTVKGAAQDLTEALTPPSPPEVKVPDWLNTP